VERPALDRFAVLSERERRDRNASFAVRMQVELVLVPKDMLLAPMLPLNKSHMLVMIQVFGAKVDQESDKPARDPATNRLPLVSRSGVGISICFQT
jgi:hypothetical protein